jgi:hypothetical protein
MYLRYNTALNQMKTAIREVEEAREFFNQATPEIIDEAIYELKAKELRLNRIIREMKRERGLKTIEC